MNIRMGLALDRQSMQPQRGVASLLVVMVLFFILSLVAAYTSRNLIFEQRTSANQYRSTQAFEAAEAGIEWTLAMLNGSRIDDTCTTPVPADNTKTTFRRRYLEIDPSSGNVTPLTQQPGGAELWPTCVLDGDAWRCSCPTNAAPSLAAAAGNGAYPAFRVRLLPANPPQPGVVRLESTGCTRLDENCLTFPARGGAGDAGTTVSTLVALQSGLAMPPVAALSVRGNLNAPGLIVVNENTANGGITVQTGSVASAPTVFGPPGTPPALSIVESVADLFNMRDVLGRTPSDTGFDPMSRDNRMFASVFGMWPETYRTQPGAVELTCAAGACSASDVRTAAEANPGRVLWVPGNLDFDSVGAVGSATAPLVIVATGNVTFTEPTVVVYGLVYSRAANWSSSGGGTVIGAAVAETALTGGASTRIVYDVAVLSALRRQTGSFIRVPGSWRDFP